MSRIVGFDVKDNAHTRCRRLHRVQPDVRTSFGVWRSELSRHDLVLIPSVGAPQETKIWPAQIDALDVRFHLCDTTNTLL